MDGPFEIQHIGKTWRPCYIVTAFASGVVVVYEPEVKLDGETLSEQWELAKETGDGTEKFKSWGKANYHN